LEGDGGLGGKPPVGRWSLVRQSAKIEPTLTDWSADREAAMANIAQPVALADEARIRSG
jgi:hypothetical protein